MPINLCVLLKLFGSCKYNQSTTKARLNSLLVYFSKIYILKKKIRFIIHVFTRSDPINSADDQPGARTFVVLDSHMTIPLLL